MPDEGTLTQVAEQPKDQEQANIDAYARIFRKCLQVAKRIAEESGGGDPLKIADSIFSQYYHDQIEIMKQRQLVDWIKSLTRGRGF